MIPALESAGTCSGMAHFPGFEWWFTSIDSMKNYVPLGRRCARARYFMWRRVFFMRLSISLVLHSKSIKQPNHPASAYRIGWPGVLEALHVAQYLDWFKRHSKEN